VQWRFFSAPEQSQVTGNIAMLPGATREDTLAMIREMQRATEALGAKYEEEHGRSPLEYVVAQIGSNSGRALSGSDSKSADQLGAITIELIDADSRPYSSFAFNIPWRKPSVSGHGAVGRAVIALMCKCSGQMQKR